MKKNGFTFIEILGVVTLLALIGTIIIITVDKSIKDSKQTITKAQMENIRSSASMWMADNIEKIPNNGYYTINLETLEKEGYISEEIEKTIEINKNNYIIQISMNNILIGEETGFNTMDAFITDNASKQIETIKNQQLSLTGIYQLNDNGQISDGINTYETNITETKLKGGYLIYRDDTAIRGCMTIDEYKVTITDEEVEKIENGICERPKCVRAIEKHTEECIQINNFCYEDGYYSGGTKNTTTIEYGNLGEKGAELKSGDALDCDINGDNIYDSETERFYYITDFTSDDNKKYSVLIYYNNTSVDINGNVIPDNTINSLIPYDSTHSIDVSENWHGPLTAINNLPTINDWNNITLSNNNRIILNENKEATTNNGSNNIQQFNYIKEVNDTTIPLAARLLTTQEVNDACGIKVGSIKKGELSDCNFLLENTKYSSSKFGTGGYWLENPYSNSYSSAWTIGGNSRYVYNSDVSNNSDIGVRPVIEVLKTDISLY